MEWIDALGDEKSTEPEAVKSCSDKLLSRRSNPPVSLPEASPFVRFSERTGRAGVKKDLDDWLDISTTRKRKMNNGTEEIGHHFLPVLPEEDKHVYAWAQSFDPKEDGSERLMPFLEGVQPSLGVIHADGNGLGVALQSLQAAAQKPDEYQYIYWEFSRAIATATRNAVQAATKDISDGKEIVTPEGLRYTDLKIGGGSRPQRGYLVVLDYKAYANGKQRKLTINSFYRKAFLIV